MSKKSESAAAKRGSAGPGIDVRPSDDFMKLLISCTIPPREAESILSRIRSALVDLGVRSEERLDEAMARLDKATAQNPVLEDVILLEGVPPEPPRDEGIKWHGNFHVKGFVIDPVTGRADYRRTLADVSVKQDQLLAEIIAGSPGENGQDVFGRLVPPRDPRPVTVFEGINVRFDQSSRRYYAVTAGRVRFVDNRLSVDDIYRIKGDAGLRTGNIDHPGALVVDRDIQSETEIRADGDIDVGENIEDALVVSGGNITVQGGISCKERGTIRVAGNLHARFIRNADIDALGDVFVDSEINQCNIRTRGSVIVREGRIVGGTTFALKGVEVQDLGSDACIPGETIVGKDYTVEATVNQRKAELESTKALVLRLRDQVAPLRAKRDSLTPPLQQQLAKLQAELKKREAAFKKQDKALKAVFTATKKAAVAHVYVYGTLFPDNLIQVSAQVKKIRERVSGPLRLSLRKGKFSVFKLKEGEILQDRL
jgi:uncharacterized protein